ncbi:MAG TPA: hypothetical protein VKD69_16085 [Vicinamibacterales bacterium]|nr:hypothetical protein [Vicinamibacterales bacterium]
MDGSADTLALLREYLEYEGFEVETCNLARLRLEGGDIAEAVVNAKPHVVVFDIALPYEANWAACCKLQDDPRIDAPFVLTTTNRSAVERLTCARDVIEILGKPYDLEHFARAVRAAARRRERRPVDADDRRGMDRRVGDRRHYDRRRP